MNTASKSRFDVFQFVNENYLALCMCVAIVGFAFLGIAGSTFACVIGALLCIVIMSKRSMVLDLWIFVPLLAYVIFCGVSTLVSSGTLVDGYFGTQAVYLAVVLAIASMDDSEALVMRKLCVGLVAIVSVVALVVFVGNIAEGDVLRLNWPFGNADPEGIFLVIAWFMMQGLVGDDAASRLLRQSEVIILVTLALTLTMASFGALFVGAVAMLLYKKHANSWKDLFKSAVVLFARLVIGIGVGVALYEVAFLSPGSWLILLGVACVAALAFFWSRITAFLEDHVSCAAIFALLGIALAGVVLFMRSNSLGHFVERLEMIESGFGYISVNSLLGIGPFQWHELNHEAGGLFPTAMLIHSTPMCVAVELGVTALVALIVIVIRFFIKKRAPEQRGAFVAFLAQNLFDLGFFYPAVTSLLMVVVATPRSSGVILYGASAKVIPAVLCVFYVGMAVRGFLLLQF